MKNLKNLVVYKTTNAVKRVQNASIVYKLAFIFMLPFMFSFHVDININKGVSIEKSPIVEVIQEKVAKVANVVTNDVINTPKKVLPAPKSTKNTEQKPRSSSASQFPNIAFVLNPTYAKRNNVNPKIVAQKNTICNDYVKRFSLVAVKEMKKYGIPASITLAQGLLESDAGQSRLAVNNNNHFGIKCFARNCKSGHCSNHSDDSHKDFFRNYNSVWESYRAHSLFLQRSRYQHLRKIPRSDYKSWAKGLSKAGYATDKKYANKLVTLIENMKLHRFDK